MVYYAQLYTCFCKITVQLNRNIASIIVPKASKIIRRPIFCLIFALFAFHQCHQSLIYIEYTVRRDLLRKCFIVAVLLYWHCLKLCYCPSLILCSLSNLLLIHLCVWAFNLYKQLYYTKPVRYIRSAFKKALIPNE